MDRQTKEWRREFTGAIREVGRSLAWAESIAKELDLPEDQTYAILLCIEELVSNVVRHNDEATRLADCPLLMAISIRATPNRISLTIEDNGAHFDVVSAPTKKIEQPIELVEPGGLGILLVKRFASNLIYRKKEKGNEVTAEFINP